MATKNIPQDGDNDTREHSEATTDGSTRPILHLPPANNDNDTGSTNTDDVIPETNEERISREKYEESERDKYLKSVHGDSNSRLYREAQSRFDPNETQDQLAEHTVYFDKELEEYGHF